MFRTVSVLHQNKLKLHSIPGKCENLKPLIDCRLGHEALSIFQSAPHKEKMPVTMTSMFILPGNLPKL